MGSSINKDSTIKASLSGDVSISDNRVNLFDLVHIEEGSGIILSGNGIGLYQHSNIIVFFSVSAVKTITLNCFEVLVDAQRVYNALQHLRSLCTKKKDPFEK